tara:strand:- start:213 stop:788 length:576 start_codon:yes stop_codon:yes gene_type:complete
MEKSETIGNLTLALSKVQAQLRPAKENSKNPFFKSNYADLGSVWDSVRSLLAENELSIIQMPTDVGGLTTILSHSSGEYLSSTMYIPSKEDAHGVGSAISYARRYALASFIGVVTGDDDGNGAVKGHTSPPAKATTPKSKPKLSSEQYKAMMTAIEQGKGSVVEQKMNGYILTKTQQDNLDKVIKISKTLA